MLEQESLDFTPRATPDRAARTEAQPALLLTVNDAAQMLGCGRTLIYELLGSGDLEAVKIHRLRRIPADSLQDYITRLRARQAA